MVKHWIDLGRVSIRTTRGVAHVYGWLLRLPGAESELTGPLVQAMFDEILRSRKIKRVIPHIENWTNKDGMWRPVETNRKRRSALIARPGKMDQKDGESGASPPESSPRSS